MDFDVSAFGAFLAGVLSFAAPCVLPLVPPYLAFIAGVSLGDLTGGSTVARPAGRIMLSAAAFVLGFSTVFLGLGATATYFGRFIGQHYGTLSVIAGLLIILFGLHFLGLFRIGLLYREARLHVERRPPGLLGAYAIGLAFAFGWTPCAGPVLTAILMQAGSQDEVSRGLLLLALYSAGLGIPFLLAAAFTGTFLRLLARSRRWLGLVEKAMGVMLVVTGLLFVSGSMSTLGYRLLEWLPWLGGIG